MLTSSLIPISSNFSTSFPGTEANLSQGGIWTIGDNSGTNAATGPQTTPGVCFAHAADAVDYLGILKNRFLTTKHYAQQTVRRVGGYTAPSTHECELLIGFDLGSGLSTGYELDFWFDGTLQPVRWNNGAIASYDFGVVTTLSGSWPGAVNGDVIRATFDSSSGSPVIAVALNGSTVVTFTDVTAGKILSGSPGLGFFAQPGATLPSYAMSAFAAGNA